MRAGLINAAAGAFGGNDRNQRIDFRRRQPAHARHQRLQIAGQAVDGVAVVHVADMQRAAPVGGVAAIDDRRRLASDSARTSRLP